MKHVLMPSILTLILASGCQSNPPTTQVQEPIGEGQKTAVPQHTVLPHPTEELVQETPIFTNRSTTETTKSWKEPPHTPLIKVTNTQPFSFPQMHELPPTIVFNHDSWVIHMDHFTELRNFANYLETNDYDVLIEGHCDESGTNAYNLVLGQKRAEAVKEFMNHLGINQERIQVTSYGEERPLCQTADEACNQINRRAQFVLVKQ